MALAKLGNPEVIGQFALGLAMLWTEYKHTPHSLRLLQTTVLSGNRHPTYEFSDHLGLRILITAALALLTIKTIS